MGKEIENGVEELCQLAKKGRSVIHVIPLADVIAGGRVSGRINRVNGNAVGDECVILPFAGIVLFFRYGGRRDAFRFHGIRDLGDRFAVFVNEDRGVFDRGINGVYGHVAVQFIFFPRRGIIRPLRRRGFRDLGRADRV